MKFAVTFQQRYRFHDHPIIPEVTHRSYLVVEAENEYTAREWLIKNLGNDYAFLYEWDEFEEQTGDYLLEEVVMPDGA